MKNLKLLLLFCFSIFSLPVISQISTGQEQEFDNGIKNNSTQTILGNPAYIVTQGSDGTYGKSTMFSNKSFLSTGLLKNGLLSINIDNTKYNISAGIGVISNFDNPETPTSQIVSFPAVTGKTPTYLTTGNITYVAIKSDGTVEESSTPFTNQQRRSLIILGAVIHSNLTNINVVNNISAPSEAIGNQLHDFIEAVGALNLTGNKYSANGANLSLDKSAGTIFKLGVNFNNDWKNPHVLGQSSGTALTFRYRVQNGTEGSDVTVLNPTVYDLGNVLTTVPNNKFTIQTVTMFQSGLTRIQYGQNVYDTMAEAEAGLFTRNYVVEGNIAANGITRAYIIIKKECTSLQSTAEAKIIESTKFGSSASGGIALTFANIVAALGYTPSNDVDVVHKTGNETVAGIKTFSSAPIFSTTSSGRVHFSGTSSALADSSKFLWDDTSSKLEVNGNSFNLRLKETLNNSYVDIVNTSFGSSSLQFKSNYGGGKVLMTLLNKTGTNASQLAVGNVSSVPAESQLYIYGGDNGANIDMRGLTTRDEANMDLEGSNWETFPNSLGFSYFGPNFSIGGTIMGYPKIKTGVIRFNNADNALIVSNNSEDIVPIRFGINDVEVFSISDNVVNSKQPIEFNNGTNIGVRKLDDGAAENVGHGGNFFIGNSGSTFDRFFFLSKDNDVENFGSVKFYANAEEGVQIYNTDSSNNTGGLAITKYNTLYTYTDIAGNSTQVDINPSAFAYNGSDGVNSNNIIFRPTGAEFYKPITLFNSTLRVDNEEANFNITNLTGTVLFEFASNPLHSTIISSSALTASRTYNVPNKSGTIALTSDVPTTGIFTPATGGGITYSRSYYSKVGNILTIQLNGEYTVGSAGFSTSTTFTIPNSYTVANVVNNRTVGSGTLGTASNTAVGSVKVSENSSDTTILNLNLGGSGLSLTTHYFSTTIVVEVN
jgi:hypothetical protein